MNNEQEIAQEVEKLKTLRATPEWVESLRARVMQQLDEEVDPRTPTALPSPYSWLVIFQSPARVVVSGTFVLLLAVSLVTHDQLIAGGSYAVGVYSIERGTNAYERGNASLEYSARLERRFEDSSHIILDATYLRAAISSNRRELDGLKLMGEAGKYSQAQCLELYRRYDQQLDKLKTIVAAKLVNARSETEKIELKRLYIEILDAIGEAEMRINLYPAAGR